MHFTFRRFFAPYVFTLLLFAGLPANAGELPIPSVWELVEISPVSLMDSNPRGVANHREYYTDDGRLCILEPSETFPANQSCAKVQLDSDVRLVTSPDGQEYPSTILSLSEKELIIQFPDQSVFSFHRLADTSVERPIRPRSLHVLKVSEGRQLNASDVHYLAPDSIPRPRSLIGVWEALEYRDIPYVDLPPYGFPNEKWVFTETSLARLPPDETDPSTANPVPYDLEGMTLELTGESEALAVSFDDWGDLLLSSPSGVLRFRQLSLDPSQIPVIPTKIAVLVPEGD